MWRRLVARYLGVVEAVGSSPVTQTMKRHAVSVREITCLFVFSTQNQFLNAPILLPE